MNDTRYIAVTPDMHKRFQTQETFDMGLFTQPHSVLAQADLHARNIASNKGGAYVYKMVLVSVYNRLITSEEIK
jgi:hypothetical protein